MPFYKGEIFSFALYFARAHALYGLEEVKSIVGVALAG